MLITIPNVLSKHEITQFREHLDSAEWRDGLETAGSLAINVKNNLQLADETEPALSLSKHILQKLAVNPTFVSASLPNKIYPPKFNRYENNGTYGNHIDGSIMQIPGTSSSMRTDVSATLFLNEPDEYDGGELTVETQYGRQTVKLPAGDMVVYPSTSLHQVTPVTKGRRIAAFMWIQSMVRDSQQREMLFNLDKSVQKLSTVLGADDEEVTRLSGLYHNLIRQWAVA